MVIGKKLKELREKTNLTQYRLAKLSGVSQSHISEIESGAKEPTTGTLIKLCSAMGITLAEFFDDGTRPTPIPDHLKPLLDQARDLTPEQAELLANFIKTMKK